MLRRRRRETKRGMEREVPTTPMQWRRLLAYLSSYKLRLLAATVGLFSHQLGQLPPDLRRVRLGPENHCGGAQHHIG